MLELHVQHDRRESAVNQNPSCIGLIWKLEDVLPDRSRPRLESANTKQSLIVQDIPGLKPFFDIAPAVWDLLGSSSRTSEKGGVAAVRVGWRIFEKAPDSENGNEDWIGQVVIARDRDRMLEKDIIRSVLNRVPCIMSLSSNPQTGSRL